MNTDKPAAHAQIKLELGSVALSGGREARTNNYGIEGKRSLTIQGKISFRSVLIAGGSGFFFNCAWHALFHIFVYVNNFVFIFYFSVPIYWFLRLMADKFSLRLSRPILKFP